MSSYDDFPPQQQITSTTSTTAEEKEESSQRIRILTEQKIQQRPPEPKPALMDDPLVKQIKGGLQWYDDPQQRRNNEMISIITASSSHFYLNKKVSPVVLPLLDYYKANNINYSEPVCQFLIGQARKLVASKEKQQQQEQPEQPKQEQKWHNDYEKVEFFDNRVNRFLNRIEREMYELFKGENWQDITLQEQVRAEMVFSHFADILKKVNDEEIPKDQHNNLLYDAKLNLNANRVYLEKQDLAKKYDDEELQEQRERKKKIAKELKEIEEEVQDTIDRMLYTYKDTKYFISMYEEDYPELKAEEIDRIKAITNDMELQRNEARKYLAPIVRKSRELRLPELAEVHRMIRGYERQQEQRQ